MSVSDRGPEAIFCWKFLESIMARGRFDGLFLQGVARQANETAAVMAGELGRPGARLGTDMKDGRGNNGTRFKFGRGTLSRSYERRNYSVCATTAFVFAPTAARAELVSAHLFPRRSFGWLPPGFPEFVYALYGIG